ncbi:MAG: DUF4079 domain-containing protein [Coleofasciculaceae cyanobacterium]
MEANDLISLIHPAIAVTVVFPLIGMVVNFAWQTRQRRLQSADNGKSKIPPVVGREHVSLGRWLTGAVVGITLIALFYSITFESIIEKELWSKNPSQVLFITLMFAATIGSLVLLYRARETHWRGIFATLTGIGLVVLGCQDGVFRRTNEWYWSHYYIGITAALLMVFSLAIIEDIYKDRTNRWRNIHIVLNCLALLLFVGQGMTGARDLLESPLSWQKSFIEQCNFENKTCPQPAPPIQK